MGAEFFTYTDGSHLWYETAGEGPAVAFLHGFTLDLRMWDDQFVSFATRHRVLRHDFRGFGESKSPPPGEPYAHAADLIELLRFNGIDRVALVGLSYGGWAALDSLIPLARSHGISAAKAAWGDHPFFAWSKNNEEVKARLDAMVGDYPGWHWLNADPRSIDRPVHERLAEIDVPTLVVAGEHDIPDFHIIARMLSDGIRGAESVVLPGAGHMTNMDAPELFNEIMLNFLQRSEP